MLGDFESVSGSLEAILDYLVSLGVTVEAASDRQESYKITVCRTYPSDPDHTPPCSVFQGLRAFKILCREYMRMSEAEAENAGMDGSEISERDVGRLQGRAEAFKILFCQLGIATYPAASRYAIRAILERERQREAEREKSVSSGSGKASDGVLQV